jgi:hypothetical protein
MGQSARKRWKSIPKLRRLAILAGKMSDGSLPPSPPAEKAAARQDQTGKASTGEGSGNWSGIGSDDAREVARGRIVVVEKCGVAHKRRGIHVGRWDHFQAAERGAVHIEVVGRANRTEEVAGREIGIERP